MTTEESITSTSTASSSSSIQLPLATHPSFDIYAFNNQQFDFLINGLEINSRSFFLLSLVETRTNAFFASHKKKDFILFCLVAKELCRIAAQLSYGSVFNNRIGMLLLLS
jgi:hypothetical protein